MAGLGTIAHPSHAVQSGIISAMMISQAAYFVGSAPVVHLLSVELLGNRLRDLTYRTAMIIQILVQ